MININSEVTTLTTCWQIKRRDKVTLSFTSLDQDLEINGTIYTCSNGFTPTAITGNSDLSVDNLEISGMLDSELITEEDILAGLYDYAEISIFLVDYSNPNAGKINLRTGWLGEVQHNGKQFTAEIRGLIQAFTQNIGTLYSPNCRANFCDHQCGLNETDFTFNSVITEVIGKKSFLVKNLKNSSLAFNGGKIKFLTKENQGLSMEIRFCLGNKVELVFPTPFKISANAEVILTAGCDKTIKTCSEKYNNAINFRGEPHVPIPERMAQ